MNNNASFIYTTTSYKCDVIVYGTPKNTHTDECLLTAGIWEYLGYIYRCGLAKQKFLKCLTGAHCSCYIYYLHSSRAKIAVTFLFMGRMCLGVPSFYSWWHGQKNLAMTFKNSERNSFTHRWLKEQ